MKQHMTPQAQVHPEPPASEHATVTELITNDNKNMHGSEKLSSSASYDGSLGVIKLSDDESDETGGNLNKRVFIKEEKEQQQKEIAIEPIARNAESITKVLLTLKNHLKMIKKIVVCSMRVPKNHCTSMIPWKKLST
ncbi:uncharacterized protein [Eurosta solidaginis]|uniref:uncharacterized protein isoform X2 n=1 Tax=Eurosta solidaginis TaxID=178769 RepID=UPI003530E0CB